MVGHPSTAYKLVRPQSPVLRWVALNAGYSGSLPALCEQCLFDFGLHYKEYFSCLAAQYEFTY